MVYSFGSNGEVSFEEVRGSLFPYHSPPQLSQGPVCQNGFQSLPQTRYRKPSRRIGSAYTVFSSRRGKLSRGLEEASFTPARTTHAVGKSACSGTCGREKCAS